MNEIFLLNENHMDQVTSYNLSFSQLFHKAFLKREKHIFENGKNALRIFNGFTEGFPEISIDLYGRTLVIHSFNKTEGNAYPLSTAIGEDAANWIPDLKCILLKERFSKNPKKQQGTILFGNQPDVEIAEWDTRYKINLQLNRDCSFYLDSSLLRKWLLENSAGKRVFNTFAYTGSLGMAALAGNAKFVIQTDLNPHFLQIFSETAKINQIDPKRYRIIPGNFFRVASDLRQNNNLFDTVIIDPPFFSKTDDGIVDQLQNGIKLINKIRPLVAEGGNIITINNALFLSGKEYLAQLEKICTDSFVQIKDFIPVPTSFFGGEFNQEHMPADPAPFNHSTKIVILEVHRKDGRYE